MAPRLFARFSPRPSSKRSSRIHPTPVVAVSPEAILLPTERDYSAPTIPILPAASSKLSLTEPGDTPRKRRFINDMGCRIKRAMTGIFGKGLPSRPEDAEPHSSAPLSHPIVFQRPEEVEAADITDDQRLEYQMARVDEVFARAVLQSEQMSTVSLSEELLHETRVLMEMLRAEQSKVLLEGPRSCKSSLSSTQLSELPPQPSTTQASHEAAYALAAEYSFRSTSSATSDRGVEQGPVCDGSMDICGYDSSRSLALTDPNHVEQSQSLHHRQPSGEVRPVEHPPSMGLGGQLGQHPLTSLLNSSLLYASIESLNLTRLFGSTDYLSSLVQRHSSCSSSASPSRSVSPGFDAGNHEVVTSNASSKGRLQRIGGSRVLELATLFEQCNVSVPASLSPLTSHEEHHRRQ